ncbi:MAG: hypothetical protein Q9162_006569 [Coniocarpon cinnabarinum]
MAADEGGKASPTEEPEKVSAFSKRKRGAEPKNKKLSPDFPALGENKQSKALAVEQDATDAQASGNDPAGATATHDKRAGKLEALIQASLAKQKSERDSKQAHESAESDHEHRSGRKRSHDEDVDGEDRRPHKHRRDLEERRWDEMRDEESSSIRNENAPDPALAPLVATSAANTDAVVNIIPGMVDTTGVEPAQLAFRYVDREERDANKLSRDYERGESNDQDAIRAQVEFYLSDANLPIDNYLLGLTNGSENKSVPIKVLHSFKRMRHYQPYSAVVAALEDSEKLEVVHGNEPGSEMVKRKTPLSDIYIVGDVRSNRRMLISNAQPRTAYVYGFKEERPNHQEEVEFWAKALAPEVLAVRLNRNPIDARFRRGVYIEFGDETQMQEFLEHFEGGKEYPEDQSELFAKSAEDHYEEHRLIREKKEQRNEARFQNDTRHRSGEHNQDLKEAPAAEGDKPEELKEAPNDANRPPSAEDKSGEENETPKQQMEGIEQAAATDEMPKEDELRKGVKRARDEDDGGDDEHAAKRQRDETSGDTHEA